MQDIESAARQKHRAWMRAASAVVVFIAALLFYLSYYDRGMMLADEGTLIHSAQRILNGQLPYVDFYHFYAPGSFYLLAGLFRAFGESFLVYRLMWVVVRALCTLLAFLVARRFMPSLFALLPTLLLTLIPGPWFKSFFAFSALLALWTTLLYMERPDSRTRLALAALAAGVAVLLRQDVGAAAAATLFAAIGISALATPRPERPWRRMIEHGLIAATVIAFTLAPAMRPYIRRNAMADVWKQIFGYATSYTASKVSSRKEILQYAAVDHVIGGLLAVPAVAAAGSLLIAFGAATRRGFTRDTARILPLVLMTLATAIPVYVYIAPIRLYQCMATAWIAAAFVAWKACEALGGGVTRLPPFRGRTLLRYLPAVVVTAGAFALARNLLFTKRPDLASTDYSGMITSAMRNDTPFVFRGERIYLPARKGRRLLALVDYIQRRTSPGEPILVFPNQALLYYLCDRPNHTRLIGTFTLKYPQEVQDRAEWRAWATEARRIAPRYIIVSRKFHRTSRHHDFQSVIGKQYVRDRDFGSLLVFRRKD